MPLPRLSHHKALDSQRLRLGTVVRLRWLALAGQFVTVCYVGLVLGLEVPWLACLAIIGASAGINIVLLMRRPSSTRLSHLAATLLFALDIVQLSALLLVTGGLQNPFAFLLTVPIAVSAANQSPRHTASLAILAMVAATILTTAHWPLPWYRGENLTLPLAYIWGVWAAVVCGVVFTAFYAWRVAREARLMSDALAATEQVLAREQQLSALDGMAAAAAHGLGTPLATISLVTRELERELPADSPIRDDILLLRQQANRCKEILQTLTQESSKADLLLTRMPLSQVVAEAIEPHRIPGITVHVSCGPVGLLPADQTREPMTLRSPGLMHAISNIVENAVDFSRRQVDITVRWTGRDVTLTIADDGPGFSAEVRDLLGEPFISTRAETPASRTHTGMGLGFFIAKTLLERSGAELEFANRRPPETGAIVRLRWPRDLLDLDFRELA